MVRIISIGSLDGAAREYAEGLVSHPGKRNEDGKAKSKKRRKKGSKSVIADARRWNENWEARDA